MHTEVLQISLLTAYGKAYIEGKDVSFEKNHPGAYNHRNIRFVAKLPQEQLIKKDIIAENPNDWFKYLKKEKFIRLHLTYQPSAYISSKARLKSVSDNKGSHWHIIAEKEEKCDIWKSKWQSESGELMSYYFLMIKDLDLGSVNFPTIETTKLYLKEILNDLVEFTKKNELTNWIEVFQNALNYLSIENPSKLIEDDYLPTGCYSLEAKQILAACDQAWVFGGIGSWNDVVHVHDYDLYRRLTANLYDTLCNSIVSAINSYPDK
ncbi:MAG: hypothetical protein HZR80_10955 [Candidatus Heimdallarchaeota archaeon]